MSNDVVRASIYVKDPELVDYLNSIPPSRRSAHIRDLIKKDMNNGNYLIIDKEPSSDPQIAPPLEEQVGHPLNERSAEGLEESPEDLGSLKESGSSLKQSEPTDTSDSLTPLLTLLSHRLTESLKEE